MSNKPVLHVKYEKEIFPALKQKYGHSNVHSVAKLDKIVINVGAGEASTNKNIIDQITKELSLITGQKPVTTHAKKSNASFKIREGMAIGCKVTLRGQRMYDFLYRLTAIAMPRIRDFRGVSPKSFDGRGNFAMGLKEQTVFPEINFDDVEAVRGMDIIICTTAKTDDEARDLLAQLQIPFKK
jgi:large subunit ribosomal protein L5